MTDQIHVNGTPTETPKPRRMMKIVAISLVGDDDTQLPLEITYTVPKSAAFLQAMATIQPAKVSLVSALASRPVEQGRLVPLMLYADDGSDAELVTRRVYLVPHSIKDGVPVADKLVGRGVIFTPNGMPIAVFEEDI